MPRGDGSGPRVGLGQGGRGMMRSGGNPPTYCRCPQCGYKAAHARGMPCNQMTCPTCGSKLMPC